MGQPKKTRKKLIGIIKIEIKLSLAIILLLLIQVNLNHRSKPPKKKNATKEISEKVIQLLESILLRL